MRNLIFLLLFICSFLVFGQNRIKLDWNNQKMQLFAKEVYNDQTQYLTPEHIEIYQTFVNRIEVITVSKSELDNGNYPLISTLGLINKYNIDLDYDKGPNFDINTFNPLKYFWIMKQDGSSEYYRIYGENYLIRLLPN